MPCVTVGVACERTLTAQWAEVLSSVKICSLLPSMVTSPNEKFLSGTKNSKLTKIECAVIRMGLPLLQESIKQDCHVQDTWRSEVLCHHKNGGRINTCVYPILSCVYPIRFSIYPFVKTFIRFCVDRVSGFAFIRFCVYPVSGFAFIRFCVYCVSGFAFIRFCVYQDLRWSCIRFSVYQVLHLTLWLWL